MRRIFRDRIHRASGIGALLIGCLVAAGCTSAPEPTTQASPTPANSAPASPAPAAQSLVIDVSLKGGQVDPSGRKIDAKIGQPIVLNVTSDTDDEIHAHTGGDGFTLDVKANQKATGTFTLTSPGSFEVESHHLAKVIVILNAR